MAPLSVYKASAGSGKTFRLTLGYLELLFSNPLAYRSILAVTFTNKAASEMKSRILDQLYDLSRMKEGDTSTVLEMLESSTKLPGDRIISEARELLVRILNDYSRFTVGTIDRFFQGVIRSFTREIGLQAGFSLELDRERILGEAIDRMFLDLGEDRELLDWMLKLAETRIEASKGWNFRNELMGLGQELFTEIYQSVLLEKDEIIGKGQLDDFIRHLEWLRQNEVQEMKSIASEALAHMQSKGYTPDDFFRKSQGPAGFLQKVASAESNTLTPAVVEAISDVSKWISKNETDSAKINFTENDLMPALRKIRAHEVLLNSAEEVRKYIFTLGILSDISSRIMDITDEKNLFLLSDAARFLKGLIGNNPAPFVYEKTGNYIDHIMLDEFQDTSVFQWQNFRPLLEHTLSTGHENIIVGDIKQSIYRWRNSDWKILADTVGRSFPGFSISFEPLDTNWRSKEKIIRFNNTLFTRAPEMIRDMVLDSMESAGVNEGFKQRWEHLLDTAYQEVEQQIPAKPGISGGYIRGEILKEEGKKSDELALQKIPGWIMELEDAGYHAGDIAILVRTNDEGAQVARALMEAESNIPDQYDLGFISNESLYLDTNISVKFILSLLRYVHNDQDDLNNITLCYYHRLVSQGSAVAPEAMAPGFSVRDELAESFIIRIPEFKRLPLFELVETLIDYFHLQNRLSDLPYIQAFQEIILELQQKEPGSLHDFLQYWSEYGKKKSISISDDQDSIRIITIHKSKGLQYKAVIIPFCDWELTTSGSGFNDRILWCETEETPFNDLPVAPLKYSKNLLGTIFANAYLEEMIMGYVDNLNLLYVAFTRAEEAMIIGLPVNEEEKLKLAGDLVLGAMETAPPSVSPLHMNVSGAISPGGFEIGKLEGGTGRIMTSTEAWMISGYPVKFRNERIRLRMKSNDYFLKTGEHADDHLDFGNVMHELFGRIRTRADVSNAVQQYQREGLVTDSAARKLERDVLKKLDTPGVEDWFAPEATVFCEQDILSSGAIFRPDRVTILGDRVIVTDYKFGDAELAKYDRQVKRYAGLMREMGYINVEGYIWYVMLDKIVRVE